MTAQAPDHVFYQGDDYHLIGIRGRHLPTPTDFGLHPVSMDSGYRRGYVASYRIVEQTLTLSRLHIQNIEPDSDGIVDWKPINGINPETAHRRLWSGDFEEDGKLYRNLDFPTIFEGQLLGALHFIGGVYVNVGYPKPFQYLIVRSFKFTHGKLVAMIDCSDEVGQWRNEFMQQKNLYHQTVADLKEQGLSDDVIQQKLAELDLGAYYKGIANPYSLDFDTKL